MPVRHAERRLSEDPPRRLSQVAAAGFGWLFLQSAGSRAIAFLSQIVLAWLLAPSDFGKLGLATTVIAIVGVLAGFGVDDVLLQRLKSLRRWAAAGFWVSLTLALVSTILVVVAAPIAARLYRTPDLTRMLLVLALALPLNALCTVPMIALRAQLRFRTLAVLGSAELAAVQLLTIALAWQGFGAMSFAIPAPIVAGAKAIVYWLMAPTRLDRPIRRRQVGYIASRGAAVFGTRLLTAAVGQGGYVALGLFASPAVVGTFVFAFRLAFQPLLMLAGNVSSVLFPTLVQLGGDPTRQREAALRASRVLAFVVMPFCLLQAALAEPLLTLVFGAKWRAAIPLVQLLSFGLGFDAVSWIAGTLLSARGEFRRSFVYSVIFSPAFFVVATLGAMIAQARGVALAIAAFYAVLAPVYSYAVFRGSPARVAGIYVTSTVLAAAAVGGAWLISLAPALRGQELVRALVIGALAPPLYLALVRAFARDAYQLVIDELGGLVSRRRASAGTAAPQPAPGG